MGLFAPLIRLSFWFNVVPPPFSPFFDALMLWGNAAFIILSILLIAVASKAKTLEKDVRKFLRRVASWSGWLGVLRLVFYGINWLRVPVLSMRFLLLFWIVPFVWWAVKLALYFFLERPKANAAAAERHAYEKWLPKANK